MRPPRANNASDSVLQCDGGVVVRTCPLSLFPELVRWMSSAEVSLAAAAAPPSDEAEYAAAVITGALSGAAAFDEYIAVLSRDMSDLCQQHDMLMRQLMDLQNQALPNSLAAAEQFAAIADHLELVFSRIDLVAERLDEVNRIVAAVHHTVKALEEPASVKERASSFFRNIGLSSKSAAASEGAWGRAPTTLTIDGCASDVFRARVQHAFGGLRSLTEPS